jgi:acetyltransferase EpsM
MRDLYCFGAGAQGRLAADLVRWHFAATYRVAGFFDDGKPAGETLPGGGRVLGGVMDAERLLPPDAVVFVALGARHRAKALQLIRDLREAGVPLASLIPPTASVSPSARLGDNCLLMPGALVGAGVMAGDLLWMHANAALEHDTSAGPGVLLGPSAAVAAGARLGAGALIGAGAVVSNRVSIGPGALLGAGAVAVRDLPAGRVGRGNPARDARAARVEDEVIALDDLRRLGLADP